MSGGVDSSVAAALMVEGGHEVVGATMKLWGGVGDSGCCSVADVEDARRAAEHLGLVHRVFNFTTDFEAHVVGPYVAAHAGGATPNPCIECNRHIKFGRFLERARRLGFDAVATGHHARIVRRQVGKDRETLRLSRGVDGAKDQSYVLSMLDQAQLARVLLPIGAMTKSEVRARARALGLATASKPDSQDVCFITSTGGRREFLGGRGDLHPGLIIDGASGAEVGRVDAVELVTVGQRRGMGPGPAGGRRYAVDVDVDARVVTVGPESALMVNWVKVDRLGWSDQPVPNGSQVLVQTSAHGQVTPACLSGSTLVFEHPVRRIAPGQTVAIYHGDQVLGSGIAES